MNIYVNYGCFNNTYEMKKVIGWKILAKATNFSIPVASVMSDYINQSNKLILLLIATWLLSWLESYLKKWSI